MKKIIKLLRRAFKPHDWKYENTTATRTCTTCGCAEQHVFDHPSSYWDQIAAGDKSKHV